MEITIGIKHIARELTFDVDEDISEKVTKALSGQDKVLDITDDKGNRILLASEALAYVQIGSEQQRFVGFGA
ncbi:MAG TPA: DUF3107 domain-containing protein [Beutenbergiaceae bacterium]|nr:DUF3107 domain-containing protein [Beutenbergiaceae bacterium]